MNWTTIKQALHTWVRLGSGLAADRVIWSGQSLQRPSKPYISMKRSGLRGRGMDWRDVEDSPTPSAGAEIVHKVRGPRMMTLTLQCHSDSPETDDPSVLLEGVRASLMKPTIKAGLDAGKVSVLTMSPVECTELPVNTTTLESRGLLIIQLSLASEVEETGTYIEFVESPEIEVTP